MMNQLEDSARNGSQDEAQAMLDELQDMFENMRGAQSAQESEAGKQLRRQMGELDKLMRDQQALRDKTFRRDQKQRQSKQDGQPPDAGQDSEGEGDPQSLQQQQQALRERLEDLKRRMKSLGMKGEQSLDDAARRHAGGRAQHAGGRGSVGAGSRPAGRRRVPGAAAARRSATPSMRRAARWKRFARAHRVCSSRCRRWARAATAIARCAGKGQRTLGRDPLGRGNGDRGASEGQLHESPEAAARARQVQQELRRRLSDPNRATEERDYLERLLTP